MLSQEHVSLQPSPISSGQWLPCWMGKTWILGSFYLLNQSKHVLLPGCSVWKGGKREIILLRTQARYDGVSLRLWPPPCTSNLHRRILDFDRDRSFPLNPSLQSVAPRLTFAKAWIQNVCTSEWACPCRQQRPCIWLWDSLLVFPFAENVLRGEKNGVKNEVNFWFWQWNLNVCCAFTASLLC